MDLLRLLSGFTTATLPKAAWTHEAHLLAGLSEVLAARAVDANPQRAADRALGDLRRRIMALNDAHGVANSDTSGYHHTLTWFYVDALGAFLDERGVDAAALTRRELAELGEALLAHPLAAPDAPLTRFTVEQLASPRARREVIVAGVVRPGHGGVLPAADTQCGDFVTAA